MSHKSIQPSERKVIFDFSQIEESLREETKRRYEYVKKALEDVQKSTDKCIKDVDDLIAKKDKEIMEV